MNSRRFRVFALCATVLSSALAFSQTDIMGSGSTNPNQPLQPGQVPNGPTTQTQDSNSAGDTIRGLRDRMFLQQAAEGGIAEVQCGKLAAEKGVSDDVKSFGQRMVDDHGKLNTQIASLADSMGVMLPKRMNKADQAEYDKLNSLSGDDFDREYITAMVKDHHSDLHNFRIEANSTNDNTLKETVANAAHIIHEHMVMIDKIAQSKGIATPQAHNKPTPPPAS